MILTDLSVKRPVFASVISILLIAFGLVSFDKLPLREYPNIDPPIVSVQTNYRGASAAVVESRITQLVEDRISGVEGIRNINSSSRDGRSSVTLEFDVGRDIEAAANDVRDRISGLLNNLPEDHWWSNYTSSEYRNHDKEYIRYQNRTLNLASLVVTPEWDKGPLKARKWTLTTPTRWR